MEFFATALNQIVSFFVSIVTLLLPLTSSGATALSPAPQPPALVQVGNQTQELKIMSFNVLVGGEGEKSPASRLEGVKQTILLEMPDSVGLQEANEFWRCTLGWELRDKYAVACNYGRQLGFSEGSPILYRKDKYVCIAQGWFWLSDRPDIYSMGWGASVTRLAGWALLMDKSTGFRYYHYNAHFDHISELARTNSAALLANRINARNQPTVLTGDFNANPSSQAYAYLIAGGLQDSRLLAAQADSGRSYHGYSGASTSTGDPIDFVMANQYLRSVSKYAIIHNRFNGIYPSDHFAIVSTLTMAQRA
ncbi:MAG: endonuclease/exonuclease/phosphatase family protein [Oscillospiraceae bacterium]|jgi:endonuclease/exonuclease/phosphatase family metal-dependent hydrolase|nr:endonuclease/exonuclease/phosphatase family protein [Oscillospiraceae bacterium]